MGNLCMNIRFMVTKNKMVKWVGSYSTHFKVSYALIYLCYTEANTYNLRLILFQELSASVFALV